MFLSIIVAVLSIRQVKYDIRDILRWSDYGHFYSLRLKLSTVYLILQSTMRQLFNF